MHIGLSRSSLSPVPLTAPHSPSELKRSGTPSEVETPMVAKHATFLRSIGAQGQSGSCLRSLRSTAPATQQLRYQSAASAPKPIRLRCMSNSTETSESGVPSSVSAVCAHPRMAQVLDPSMKELPKAIALTEYPSAVHERGSFGVIGWSSSSVAEMRKSAAH